MFAAKQFDVVIGTDVHFIQPPGLSPPIPVPHPFIGMLQDSGAFKPPSLGGAKVLINSLPSATAGFSAVNRPAHIPIGGMFVNPPANEGEIFMGSATVLVEGEPLSRMGMQVLTCSDIGMPGLPRLNKKATTKALMLPTSSIISVPVGMPVLVGGPPTIKMAFHTWSGALNIISTFVLKKCLIHKFKQSVAINKYLRAKHEEADKALSILKIPEKLRDLAHQKISSFTGHPVNIALGYVYTETIDFETISFMPLIWKRTWYSSSDYEGELGYGWHHSYDMALAIAESEEGSAIAVRLADGRATTFPTLDIGATFFNRKAKMWIGRDENAYYVKDSDLISYYFEKKIGDIFLLSAIKNKNGHTVSFKRNSKGFLKEIIDSTGNVLSVETDIKGRILAVLGAHPKDQNLLTDIVKYEYDEQGNMVKSYDAHYNALTYIYENHLLVKETNKNGLSFNFEYNGKNTSAKCVRTWGDGGIYNHKLTYLEGYTIVENSLGSKASHYYEGGLVYKKVNSLGHTSFKEYNEFHDLLYETNENGATTSYIYDDNGNCISTIFPDNSITSLVFNDLNLPTKYSNQINSVWEMQYDEKGNLIGEKNPLYEVLSYEYQNGLLVAVQDNWDKTTKILYDNRKNIAQVIFPNGDTNTWEYDIFSNPIVFIDERGNQEKMTFDLLHQLVKIQRSNNNDTIFSYDVEGNLIRVKNMESDVRFEYRGLNKMSARQEAHARMEFRYDTEGDLIEIRNEKGVKYTFGFNSEQRVVEEIGFDGLKKTFELDAIGQVKTVFQPKGAFTKFQHDVLGRVKNIFYHDKTFENYSYRQDGFLMAAENNTLDVQFERDLIGRVVKERQGGHEVTSEFDAKGFRHRVSSSLGADIFYKHDDEGTLEEVRQNNWFARFTNDSKGLLAERVFTGGLRSTQLRDTLGRLIKQETFAGANLTASRRRTYSWDSTDKLKDVIDSQQGKTTYEYDIFSNLVAANNPDGTTDLRSPDVTGNLFRTKSQNDRRYGLSGQLLQSTNNRYEYDAEGNLVRKTDTNGKSWQYEWNTAGMMSQVIRPDGQTVAFEYDALGRRIAKSFQGRTTRWIWDMHTPLHEWIEASEDKIRPVRADLPLSHSKNNIDFTTWIFEPNSFVPLSKTVGAKHYNIIADHLGTPIAMHDAEGKSIWSADLDIYGKRKNQFGKAEDCPFRYQGQYEDVETSLYYNRFRYYDPEEGVYISQDPIGLNGGNPTLYGYVCDVNSWVDVLGLCINPVEKRRMRIAYKYYRQGGKSPRDIEKEFKGIDFSEKVSIQTIKKGEILNQLQVPYGEKGSYFSKTKVAATKLGINPKGTMHNLRGSIPGPLGPEVNKVVTEYTPTKNVRVLKSTSNKISDTWSINGRNKLDSERIPFEAKGGAEQLYVNDDGKDHIVLKK